MVYDPLIRQPPSPDCGRRLLPTVIDQIAGDDPNRPWGSLPYDDWDLSKGYEDISYAALANGINKLAWSITSTLGRSATFETVLYLGAPDIRYHMMQMAVCKTGHKVLFSSHLNSLPIHLHLMEATNCNLVLSAIGVHVDDILEARKPSLKHALIPELDDLLDTSIQAPLFPYTKSFAEAAHDPFVILHTSGSTGLPKAVVVNHAALARIDAHKTLALPVDGRGAGLEYTNPVPGSRELLPPVPYHVMSAFMSMIRSVFGGGVFVPGFRHKNVDTTDVVGILEHANVQVAMLMPWMMEDIARRSDGKRFMKALEFVTFGGAVLSSFAAEIWSKHTRIQNAWGSTELFSVPQLQAREDEYQYCVFNLDAGGFEFRDINAVTLDSEGQPLKLHEMVLTIDHKSEHISAWAALQGVTADSDTREKAIGDLWTPHPDASRAPYVWQFAGRIDDMITFSTGINLYPAPIERALGADPLVSAVQVIGFGRRQPLVLIELAEGVDAEAAEKKLWDDVFVDLNAKMPAHGNVMRTHFKLFPAGQFVRTAKGNLKKKDNEAKFALDIEETYEKFGDQWQGGGERYGSISMKVEVEVMIDQADRKGDY